jgi:hypothetical protein
MFFMKFSFSIFLFIIMLLLNPSVGFSKGSIHNDPFRQLDEILPTPTVYRNASGAPGHRYWQQKVDYKIDIRLNDESQFLTGKATIHYKNNSPDTLRYLWFQLDQNRQHPNSDNRIADVAPNKKVTFKRFRFLMQQKKFKGGFQIKSVKTDKGADLSYTINKTMMRIDLPYVLKPSQSMTFTIQWTHPLHEQKVLGGRSGYEYFKEDKNYIYEVASWFPRAAAYYDVMGWQNKQFLGRGEFTLEFGDYDVKITVPSDHIVAATGVLQNPKTVLTQQQRNRLKRAQTAKKPIKIVTIKEALNNQKSHKTTTKTWHFKAKNVRDFAFASSRKFIWDAQGYQQHKNQSVMAMSFYPNEGNPLWEKYSTEAIIHTMEQYSRYTFDYPYPVSISVNGPVGGMEYPMITFNGPRPTLDKKTGKKTYSRRTKYGLIGVIIHEVGHNYFPMIVNSDERQWTWMDEGLNTFLQFLAEQSWEKNYPSRRGHPSKIINYMASKNQVPIMTNSESILQLGPNAYGKPATALNILRETIMGRKLFDFAFKEYARRWKFKRPTPSDFFRTMEDASAVDLDWFWRGWFYTTDHVDLAINHVYLYKPNTQNPDIESAWERAIQNEKPTFISDLRNKKQWRRTDDKPELLDFYNQHDRFTPTNAQRNDYHDDLKKLNEWQKLLLSHSYKENFYIVDFSNIGGLVMPIILDITYTDKTKEHLYIPAEIWRTNPKKASKLLIRQKTIQSIVLDEKWETADVDIHNNYWPQRIIKSRFDLYKKEKKNMMRDLYKPLKIKDKKKNK